MNLRMLINWCILWIKEMEWKGGGCICLRDIVHSINTEIKAMGKLPDVTIRIG